MTGALVWVVFIDYSHCSMDALKVRPNLFQWLALPVFKRCLYFGSSCHYKNFVHHFIHLYIVTLQLTPKMDKAVHVINSHDRNRYIKSKKEKKSAILSWGSQVEQKGTSLVLFSENCLSKHSPHEGLFHSVLSWLVNGLSLSLTSHLIIIIFCILSLLVCVSLMRTWSLHFSCSPLLYSDTAVIQVLDELVSLVIFLPHPYVGRISNLGCVLRSFRIFLIRLLPQPTCAVFTCVSSF